MDSAEARTGPAEQERLAVILSVDAAGYSARSEQDEAEAVRTVQALARPRPWPMAGRVSNAGA